MGKTSQSTCPNLLHPRDKYFHLDQDILYNEGEDSIRHPSNHWVSRPYSFHRKNKLRFKQKRIKVAKSNAAGWFYGNSNYEWDEETRSYIKLWDYLRRPDMSKRKSFLKKQSARKIRHTEDVPQRSVNQKLFDYWYELT